MVSIPLRRVLTSVRPTPVPPTPHPVHPSYPGSNQPAHRHPSRANGGAPVPAPMVALLFRQVLTSVRPTPVPLTPHPVHPSHVGSNQPAHRHPSGANGGAPVLALPFRQAITSVRPTPVPPTHIKSIRPIRPIRPFRPMLAVTIQCIATPHEPMVALLF